MSARHIIFVSSTIDANLGGIARSVPALAAAVAALGAQGHPVMLLAPQGDGDTLGAIEGIGRVTVLRRDGFGGVGRELDELTRDAQAVEFISHAGIWNALNRHVARLGRRRGIPVIVSTRSMLDPWALNHRKWKKRLAWWLYARRDLLGAAAIHATAELEAGHIRRALGPACPPVFVVPNGVELPEGGAPARPAERASGTRRILFLSRIHPKKGVLDLIDAFGRVDPAGWELVIAGNDDGGHLGLCQAAAARQANAARIQFTGAVRDTDKWDLYRSADLFVLPSYSENFGIVAGEALGMGVPVITTTDTPWREYARAEAQRSGLTEEKLGLWITGTGVESLQGKLQEVLAISDAQRRERAATGAGWIRREFRWEAIGRRFIGEVEKLGILKDPVGTEATRRA